MCHLAWSTAFNFKILKSLWIQKQLGTSHSNCWKPNVTKKSWKNTAEENMPYLQKDKKKNLESTSVRNHTKKAKWTIFNQKTKLYICNYIYKKIITWSEGEIKTFCEKTKTKNSSQPICPSRHFKWSFAVWRKTT